MITVTCQYTGFQFEAESKRSKNHPMISAFLNEANAEGKHKVGAYAQAVALINEAKGNFESIDQLIAFVRAGFDAWKQDAQSIRRFTAGDYLRQRKAQKELRQRINSILKSNGYTWSLEGYEDEEDADHFAGFASAPIGKVWTLYAPDGSEVSISQAFAQLGMEVPK